MEKFRFFNHFRRWDSTGLDSTGLAYPVDSTEPLDLVPEAANSSACQPYPTASSRLSLHFLDKPSMYHHAIPMLGFLGTALGQSSTRFLE